jgi:hypothetical protein
MGKRPYPCLKMGMSSAAMISAMRYWHKNHWQHPTWVDIVIPAIAQIIGRFERGVEAVPPRSIKPEVPCTLRDLGD